jgi:predicted transcriptional regulator
MDTPPRLSEAPPTIAADKRNRHDLEAEMVAAAEAEVDAGLFVEEAEADAWIDSLGTDHELPLPKRRR